MLGGCDHEQEDSHRLSNTRFRPRSRGVFQQRTGDLRDLQCLSCGRTAAEEGDLRSESGVLRSDPPRLRHHRGLPGNEWEPESSYESDPTTYSLQDGTAITEAQYSALNDQWSVLQDEHLNGTNASVHEVTSGYIASAETKLPEKITAIEV